MSDSSSNTSSNTDVAKVRERRLPEIIIDRRGRQQMRGGMWNKKAVANWLIAKPTWQTMDDCSRFVYGFAGEKNREKCRKAIPAQRIFMRDNLERPIITKWGIRGRILSIKVYDHTNEEDKVLFRMELQRMKERSEITVHRYEQMVKFYQLDFFSDTKEPDQAS